MHLHPCATCLSPPLPSPASTHILFERAHTHTEKHTLTHPLSLLLLLFLFLPRWHAHHASVPQVGVTSPHLQHDTFRHCMRLAVNNVPAWLPCVCEGNGRGKGNDMGLSLTTARIEFSKLLHQHGGLRNFGRLVRKNSALVAMCIMTQASTYIAKHSCRNPEHVSHCSAPTDSMCAAGKQKPRRPATVCYTKEALAMALREAPHIHWTKCTPQPMEGFTIWLVRGKAPGV